MKPSVQARCPVCGEMLEVPYILIGAPAPCPHCGKTVVPKLPVGVPYPSTKYEITFGDFQQLVSETHYRAGIGELLARWFRYEICSRGTTPMVCSDADDTVDLLQLHRRIQGDSAKQRELYAVAIALWR